MAGREGAGEVGSTVNGKGKGRERREGKGVYCGGGDLQKFHCQRLMISSMAPMKDRM